MCTSRLSPDCSWWLWLAGSWLTGFRPSGSFLLLDADCSAAGGLQPPGCQCSPALGNMTAGFKLCLFSWASWTGFTADLLRLPAGGSGGQEDMTHRAHRPRGHQVQQGYYSPHYCNILTTSTCYATHTFIRTVRWLLFIINSFLQPNHYHYTPYPKPVTQKQHFL